MKTVMTTILALFIFMGAYAQYTEYTIQEGRHECDQSRFKLTGSDMTILAYLPSTALYNPKIDAGWSKLWGFSSTLDNHTHSCRIAWRCLSEEERKFVVGAYIYVNKERYIKPMDTVFVDEQFYAKTWWEAGKYGVKINDRVLYFEQPKKPGWLTHQQYPYFGGKATAPHKMKFYIQPMK